MCTLSLILLLWLWFFFPFSRFSLSRHFSELIYSFLFTCMCHLTEKKKREWINKLRERNGSEKNMNEKWNYCIKSTRKLMKFGFINPYPKIKKKIVQIFTFWYHLTKEWIIEKKNFAVHSVNLIVLWSICIRLPKTTELIHNLQLNDIKQLNHDKTEREKMFFSIIFQ